MSTEKDRLASEILAAEEGSEERLQSWWESKLDPPPGFGTSDEEVEAMEDEPEYICQHPYCEER